MDFVSKSGADDIESNLSRSRNLLLQISNFHTPSDDNRRDHIICKSPEPNTSVRYVIVFEQFWISIAIYVVIINCTAAVERCGLLHTAITAVLCLCEQERRSLELVKNDRVVLINKTANKHKSREKPWGSYLIIGRNKYYRVFHAWLLSVNLKRSYVETTIFLLIQ